MPCQICFSTLLGEKFWMETGWNSCYVLTWKQKKKKKADLNDGLKKQNDYSRGITRQKKPWLQPRWVHHGLSHCQGEIINLLFVHLGWMASMLSLAAWRKEWMWSRKSSLSVHGLGEPPRRSLSRTVENSRSHRVSGGHGRSPIPCCNFDVRDQVKEVVSNCFLFLLAIDYLTVTFSLGLFLQVATNTLKV